MISRRTFAKLTLGVLATPGTSDAQPARKIPTIAVLSGTTADYALPYIEMGRQGMRDLGYVEGKDFVPELRFADLKGPDRLRDLADIDDADGHAVFLSGWMQIGGVIVGLKPDLRDQEIVTATRLRRSRAAAR